VLDRLDDILDRLADSLNDAVAQAVKDAVGLAVQEAVQGVLTEVLTNPELLEKLRPDPVPQAGPPAPAAQGPGWLSRLAGLAKGACAKACNLAKQACGKVAQVTHCVWGAVCAGTAQASGSVKVLARGLWAFLGSAAGVAWRARQPLLIALGVGSALGLGCWNATTFRPHSTGTRRSSTPWAMKSDWLRWTGRLWRRSSTWRSEQLKAASPANPSGRGNP